MYMRTLVKRQPVFPAFNRFFFDDFFHKDADFLPATFAKNAVAVNVKEEEKSFLVDVSAPGFQKEDFKIEVNDGILTIAGEVKSEKTEADKATKFTRKEFVSTSFERSFTIDEENIDTENIAARYENGILQIQLPKRVKVENEKKVKAITVS